MVVPCALRCGEKVLEAHARDPPMCLGRMTLSIVTIDRPTPVDDLIGQSVPNNDITRVHEAGNGARIGVVPMHD